MHQVLIKKSLPINGYHLNIRGNTNSFSLPEVAIDHEQLTDDGHSDIEILMKKQTR